LKPEFSKLEGREIGALTKQYGKGHVSELIQSNVFSYSGDTPVNYELWDNSDILIHEATFLGGSEDTKIETHGNRHSLLEDVIKMVSEIKVNKLVLSHFSSRYSAEQIDRRILELCKTYGIKIPVFRVLPGQIHRDILSGNPINR
jgi:ribonuclease Z